LKKEKLPSSTLILLSSIEDDGASNNTSSSAFTESGFIDLCAVGLPGEKSSWTAICWLDPTVSALGTTEGRLREAGVCKPDGPEGTNKYRFYNFIQEGE